MNTADATSRQRVLEVLRGERDEGVVLCPGGMMSMAVTEVMDACGASWPEAHADSAKMARLALAMHEASGFDSIALPFCMTIEAESYGVAVNMGSRTVQPRVAGTPFAAGSEFTLPLPHFTEGRGKTLLDALSAARTVRPDIAIIGNLPGPLSLLGMLTDPLAVMRWTRRDPERLRGHLDRIAGDLALFGRLQAAAGADVICIAEPTGTGEILGPRLFRSCVMEPLSLLARGLRASGAAVILHICGDVAALEEELLELDVDAVSVDSMVDIAALARKGPRWRPMGNVSPFQLAAGPAEAIEGRARELLAAGVRLLAPGCGIIPATRAAHLRAMPRAVKR